MFGLSTDYIVQFDIAAILLTAMLMYTIVLRRTYPTMACRVYKVMLLFNLLSSVTDLISAYSICNPQVFPLGLNYAINIGYILFHNLTGVCFMLYVIAAIRGNFGNTFEKIVWHSVLVLMSVSTLTTPFTKFVIYFDENLQYQHGFGLYVLYVLAAFTLLYATFIFFKNRSELNQFQIATDFAFVLLILTSIVVQAVNGKLLIENFCVATACLMMNVALDNPAAYFYQNSNCYNQTAFNLTIEQKLQSGNALTLVAFTFDDLSVFRKQFSENDFGKLMSVTIRRCHKISSYRQVFALQDAIFVFINEKSNSDELIETVEKSVSRPFKLENGREVSLAPHFCKLSLPGATQTVNDVNLVIQDMLTHIYRKTGRHVILDTTKLLDDLRREDTVVHVLRDAIRNDGIKVVYQPIYDTATGKFRSAEALVRLRDLSCDIYPDEFIPIAEQNGLILDIGEIVLERVCRFLQESRCSDFGIEHLNVNLSMIQLTRKTAVERLVQICREFEIAPERITFEITETATGNGEDNNVVENIQYLEDAGFSLSLDDYGSGYSNIANLFKISFDQVKIDKSLLWEAAKNADSKLILENAVKLVHAIGKTCVVEGVENEEMEKMLKEMNVEMLQGYRYSKPLGPISLLAFLKEKN